MENKNKGGRPKIIEKRSNAKTIWFNDRELIQLNEMLNEGEYRCLNDMMRDILINRQYKIITCNFDARNQRNILIEEVRRIGINFNQLVKHFNQKKLDNFTKEEITVLIAITNQIKIIYDKIENQNGKEL
ncbi:hypothetical protein ACRASX_14775 [Flavobacterium sp. TMP13]|uniref:plasmid mobilization protein n=1 Tax=Flavobacterium sp. TMP13 TaxID=3425950 RepID=UPI003D776B64